MRRFWLIALFVGTWVANGDVAGRCGADDKIDVAKLPAAVGRKIDYVAEVQPLLRKNCYSCHGAEEQESGLRLDLKKRALQGGDGGAVIVPGKSAESRLVHLVAGLDKEAGLMPPDGKGTRLSAEQIGVLRAWIDQGTVWPDDAELAQYGVKHWSFQPITRPALPAVRDTNSVRNPIDAFVLARLEKERIAPSPEAEKNTLLRRLFLDLIGLPPTPDDVDEFLRDVDPAAYERLVDRLLASPHYGERWGRHWLDLARYADSDGYEKDKARPFAWRFRSWVIDAINADLPFDQFTREQLAGDLLPDATVPQKTAAGFHRNTLHNTEGGTDPEEDRVKKTVDRTNTLGTVWLGLTVGCAQCHSHKYDPISQREYYSLYAFFNSLNEADIDVPSPDDLAKLARDKESHDREHAKLQAALADYEATKLAAAQTAWEHRVTTPGQPEALPAEIVAILAVAADQRSLEQQKKLTDFHRGIDPELKKLKAAVMEHAKKEPKLPAELKVQSVAELPQPRETRVQVRGDFLSLGDVVEVSTPSLLPPVKPRGAKPDRIDLAQWLFDPANPLTARVAVNRIWQHNFGRGLVLTGDDFGKQGDAPSHPELLDWLAAEFGDLGFGDLGFGDLVVGDSDSSNHQITKSQINKSTAWSVKRLHRSIVTSATYRQSSAPRGELATLDPENTLLARQVRRRVESEIIRDAALSVSGMLDSRIGGPSVRPRQPSDYAAITYAGSASWPVSKGGDAYRRGLYTFFQRTSPYPMLVAFDSPDSNESCVRRLPSNTPLQSLTLWNDPVMFEAAQSLGRRIVTEVAAANSSPDANRARASHAFRLSLARSPSPRELDEVVSLYATQLEINQRNATAVAALNGNQPEPPGVDSGELAAWIIVGRTLLNLDEFIVRE